MNDIDQKLGDWATGMVVAAGVGLLIFLARLVFSRVILDRLDGLGVEIKETSREMIAELRQVAQVQQSHEQRLMMGNQAFAAMKDDIRELKEQQRADVVDLRGMIADLAERES